MEGISLVGIVAETLVVPDGISLIVTEANFLVET